MEQSASSLQLPQLSPQPSGPQTLSPQVATQVPPPPPPPPPPGMHRPSALQTVPSGQGAAAGSHIATQRPLTQIEVSLHSLSVEQVSTWPPVSSLQATKQRPKIAKPIARIVVAIEASSIICRRWEPAVICTRWEPAVAVLA